MNSKIFSVLLLLASITVSSNAQVWLNPYNGQSNSDDKGYGIVVDRAGNVYTSGYTTNDTSGIDVILIKYNNSGALQWRSVYKGTGYNTDKPIGIVIDNNDNIYICGYTTRTGGNIDYLTVKFNSSGTQQWAKLYNGTSNGEDRAWGIIVDNSGNVFVTGTSAATSSGKNCVTIKYNSAGNEVWVKSFDGPSHKDDAGMSIVKDANNNIYVGGYGKFTSSNYNDYLLIKYNSGGTEQWVKNYNGNASGEDRAWGIVIDNSDNIYITGSSLAEIGKTDIVTLKYNSAGQVLWTSRFNSPEGHDDNAFGIAVDNVTGSTYVIGTTETNNHGLDFVTLRYNNSNGSQLWNKTFDGVGHSDDIPYSLAISHSEANPHIFVAGTTRHGTNQQSEDIAVISYSSSGIVLSSTVYDGSANLDDAAFGIAVDVNDNYFISGYIGVQGTLNSMVPSHDMVTVKYNKLNLIGIVKIENNIPENYKLYQNYPNPFNPSTKIKFDLASESDVKLSVFDITGKEVGVLLNNKLAAGSYEISFNNINLSSGIYFYRLNTGSYSEIKKMTLIK
ncbi:MAG: SBBP repeat-containing protein [Ignavibacteria bacterium]